jgi:hypothetical protein
MNEILVNSFKANEEKFLQRGDKAKVITIMFLPVAGGRVGDKMVQTVSNSTISDEQIVSLRQNSRLKMTFQDMKMKVYTSTVGLVDSQQRSKRRHTGAIK